MSEVTRAIILAAGIGSRLKTFTQHTPKALIPIAGEPAIVRVIRSLVSQGIQDIAINIHHHADRMQQYLGQGQQWNARLSFSFEETLLNSGGGARQALDLLPGDGLVAIHNADVLATMDIRSLARLCPEKGCALALVPNPKHHPLGDFALNQKNISLQGQNKFTFAGVSVWDASTLQSYPTQHPFPLTQPIQVAVEQHACKGLVHNGYWFDIGRPRDLFQANRFFQQHVQGSFQ
ncbi:MAG: nucleotidyl transferase [Zetaproteobacteria bacterium CG2_30_46_52]|nr:MAG: nucleotidyl transferase [Zetaproteobacteria bacterium CG2_30_46_52]